MSPSKSADRPEGLPEQLAYLTRADWHRNRIGHSGMQVYRVETGDACCYLKCDPSRTAELEEEAARLRWLTGWLPVPEVIYSGFMQNGDPALLLTETPGDSMIDPLFLEHAGDLIACMAQGLRKLWAIPVGDCPFDARLDAGLNIAAQRVSSGLVGMSDWNPETAFPSPEKLLAYLIDNRPPEEMVVFTHGDYCLPNIFGTGTTLTGLIDWSRGGAGDPWRDLALASWSLRYNLGAQRGDTAFMDLLDLLDVRPDPYRMEYYILLDELF